MPADLQVSAKWHRRLASRSRRSARSKPGGSPRRRSSPSLPSPVFSGSPLMMISLLTRFPVASDRGPPKNNNYPPRSGHEPEGGSARPRSLKQLQLSRTSANRGSDAMCSTIVSSAGSGWAAPSVSLGEEEWMATSRAVSQSVGVSGSSEVTALLHGHVDHRGSRLPTGRSSGRDRCGNRGRPQRALRRGWQGGSWRHE